MILSAHHKKSRGIGGGLTDINGDILKQWYDIELENDNSCIPSGQAVAISIVIELTALEAEQIMGSNEYISNHMNLEIISNSYSWNFLHEGTYLYNLTFLLNSEYLCENGYSEYNFEKTFIYYVDYTQEGQDVYEKITISGTIPLCCDCTSSQIDFDLDGIPNDCDNCPIIKNNNQLDTDSDGIGDACDEDIDGDGILNNEDLCPLFYAPFLNIDSDQDGLGDQCDNCPKVKNPEQKDSNHNGIGDKCETRNRLTHNSRNINIYPNPFSDLLFLQGVKQVKDINIYTIDNQRLEIIKNISSNQVSVGIINNYNGVVIIEIINEDKSLTILKAIKI